MFGVMDLSGPTRLRLPEPHVSRGIHAGFGQAFQALLSEGQLGHWCRSHAEELRSIETAGRGMESHTVLHGCSQGADLPGIDFGPNLVMCSTTLLLPPLCELRNRNSPKTQAGNLETDKQRAWCIA